MADGPPSGGCAGATIGMAVGCAVAGVCWFLPFPVILVVWLLDIRHPFGDIMCMMIPVYMMLPLLGALIGALIQNRKGDGS